MSYRIVENREPVSIGVAMRTGKEWRNVWKIYKKHALICAAYNKKTAEYLMRLLEHDLREQAKDITGC